MKFNIIGTGRLGKNLAQALLEDTQNQLIGIYNRNIVNSKNAIHELKAGRAITTLADLPSADITFITAPDDHIAQLARTLAQDARFKPDHIVVHCSGVLRSDALQPLQDIGCLIASIHPLKAFRAHHLYHKALSDCDCVVEGDAKAVTLLTTLFTAMGATVRPILASKKDVYHAACSMACNYLITLAASTVELFEDAGIPALQANTMTHRLMQSSLNNLVDTAHASDALTGPLARGDLETIRKHLHAITTPQIETLYKAAGLATLPLTHLDVETQLAMRILLT